MRRRVDFTVPKYDYFCSPLHPVSYCFGRQVTQPPPLHASTKNRAAHSKKMKPSWEVLLPTFPLSSGEASIPHHEHTHSASINPPHTPGAGNAGVPGDLEGRHPQLKGKKGRQNAYAPFSAPPVYQVSCSERVHHQLRPRLVIEFFRSSLKSCRSDPPYACTKAMTCIHEVARHQIAWHCHSTLRTPAGTRDSREYLNVWMGVHSPAF